MDLEPFYFGTSDEPLFGLHYPPTSGLFGEVGVLLCYPIGHEYVVAHRAYRQLSIRLAEAGFHVLRFDYYASGDSGGECAQGTLSRWIRDISTAIGELRARSGCRRVCLVGCRLGATLSAIVSAERGDIEHMVLWDPVANGKEYIADIAQRHEDMLQRAHVTPRSSGARPDIREFLGFAAAATTLREIEGIDLLATSEPPAQHLLLIESQSDDTTTRLREHLTKVGSRVTYQRNPVPKAWAWIEDPGSILVPHQILNAIVTWIVQVHS